ncbi:MAG: hypothetical protein JO250_16550 [Armatimonadetes bacterium]|nr:hypothetical protein [Armatimonadota bacterium]
MAKLDRLGWAAGLPFVSHGASIGIRVTAPAVLEHLSPHLPPGWKPSASPIVEYLYSLIVGGQSANTNVRRYNMLYIGAAQLARKFDLTEVLEDLESSLQFSISVLARGRLFVHAGVVVWRGGAIVIPGRSRSGKSSLVKALVEAGATYYSDEYAVLDEQGRVHPYPKRLSLREEGQERPRLCPVEALGGRAGVRPAPVRLIAVTEYQPQAAWHPRQASAGDAVLALLDNTVLARSQSELALQTLERMAVGAVTLKGKRGEASEAAALLLQRLEALAKKAPAGRPPAEGESA